MTNYSQIALTYCEDVISGKVPACRWIKLACQRHLDDLAKQSDPEYPYRYSRKKANRFCSFAEQLPLKNSRKKAKFKAQPWQCFIFCSIFGWLRKKDNFRRFRRALIMVPKKSGKSFISAIIGTWGLRFDGEPEAEIYCLAGAKSQSRKIFEPAQFFIRNTPALRQMGFVVGKDSITVPATGSKMEIVPHIPHDGDNVHMGLIDEPHEMASDLPITIIENGTVARDQPLIVFTSTAGFNLASPAKLLQDDLQDVLQGIKSNDEFFGVIYTIDPGDDWKSPEALRKASPNFGISTIADTLLSDQQEAVQSPRKQAAFKTKYLNVWCSSAVGWMDMEKYFACVDKSLRLEDFTGEACWAGFDGAHKLDLSAYVLLFQRVIEGKTHYYLFPRFYLPSAQTDAIENSHYRQWVEAGYLTAVDGNVNDHSTELAQVIADAKQFDLRVFAHDPFGVVDMVSGLLKEGITCAEIEQKWPHQSEPMKELEALIFDGRLHIAQNAVMDWCVANTMVKFLAGNIIVPRKESSHSPKKIDGTIATIMALERAMLAPPQEQGWDFSPFTV